MEEGNYEDELEKLEPWLYHRIADVIADEIPVLDIGCGEGKLVNFLAKRGKEVWGVDILGYKVDEARKEAAKQGISHLARFMKGDASMLDFFSDNFFAAVVSVHTFHELKEPHKTLKELIRLLKGKGVLIMVYFIKGGKAEITWGEIYYTPE